MPWKPSFPGELPSLGWSLLEWWAEVLPSPRNHDAPLLLTDEQALILVEWFRFDPVTLRFIYRRGASRRSKGWGKALALDTPLPTPTGWTTMGDVQVGDDLLDENGQPTRVVAATEVMHGRPCYRVSFRDDTSVVADAEHLWPMDEFVGGPKRRRVLVTTREMHERGVRSAELDRWQTLLTPDGRDAVPARTVTAIEPVESVPVRCVAVSGPSQLYLAGEGMVPTHNSPMLAALAIAELAGDVRPDGFDAYGQPVGRPWGRKGDPNPWVQLAAVSEDQVQNTYSVVYELLSANDGRAADTLRIDMGLTRCFLIDRPGKLEPVTASAGSREGQPITFAVMDETHLWTPTNGGVKLANTLRRNVGKMAGRTYETTNSFAPGEGSVAEDTHKAVVVDGVGGVFYDAVEAPEVKPEDPDETLRSALAVAYGGAYWVDLDRLVQEIRDPATAWEDAERFFFNHNVDDRQKAVETKKWLSLRRSWEVPADTPIGLGFDGSLSDDTTALVGCVVLDEDQAAAVSAANPDLPPVPPGTPFTFQIEVWSRPPGAPPNWRVPRSEIRARVKETFNYYRVGLMLCDPAKWQTEIEFWIEEYGEEVVAMFDTNQPTRMWRACDRFSTAVDEAAYVWDGSEPLGSHVLALHRRKVRVKDDDDDGRTKYVFVKGPNRDKIDAGIAAVLALEAAQTMPSPKPKVDGALFGMSDEEMEEYERLFGAGR